MPRRSGKVLLRANEEIDDKRAEISRIEAAQKQKQKDLAAAENKLLVLAETHKRLNVALTLSQSENIVKLRKQLNEGRACPVCGATHHPLPHGDGARTWRIA